jgi:hypothetical protein
MIAMTNTALEPKFEVDLDNEKIFMDNRWLARTELAAMLTERLASMDYNVGRLSMAIEYLDKTIKALESFSVRLTPEVAAQLRDTANRGGLPIGAVIREAVVSYLVGGALSKLG